MLPLVTKLPPALILLFLFHSEPLFLGSHTLRFVFLSQKPHDVEPSMRATVDEAGTLQ